MANAIQYFAALRAAFYQINKNGVAICSRRGRRLAFVFA